MNLDARHTSLKQINDLGSLPFGGKKPKALVIKINEAIALPYEISYQKQMNVRTSLCVAPAGTALSSKNENPRRKLCLAINLQDLCKTDRTQPALGQKSIEGFKAR